MDKFNEQMDNLQEYFREKNIEDLRRMAYIVIIFSLLVTSILLISYYLFGFDEKKKEDKLQTEQHRVIEDENRDTISTGKLISDKNSSEKIIEDKNRETDIRKNKKKIYKENKTVQENNSLEYEEDLYSGGRIYDREREIETGNKYNENNSTTIEVLDAMERDIVNMREKTLIKNNDYLNMRANYLSLKNLITSNIGIRNTYINYIIENNIDTELISVLKADNNKDEILLNYLENYNKIKMKDFHY